MARANHKLALGLAVAGLTAGLAALMAGAIPTAPPPQRRPPASVANPREQAEALAREKRELTYLRSLRRQYLWGIDNLQVNQSYTKVELDRLRFQRRMMPADDPERPIVERRLRELPDLYTDYVANEARVRELLSEVESELARREAALAAKAGPVAP